MRQFHFKFIYLLWAGFMAFGLLSCTQESVHDPLKEDFKNPPDDARPGVYWYFMDGNLSREEMTKDLESMKDVGIGSVLFLEVFDNVPRGDVKFFSEEWQDLYRHAVKETGDIKYLETAHKLASAYMKRLSEDKVPYWDFDDPNIPNAPKDVSAAAIVASAFLEISDYQKDSEGKLRYRTDSEKILHALSSSPYLSGAENDAFLLHSTGNKPKNGEVDIPIIYADYYYIEALVRLKKMLENEKH